MMKRGKGNIVGGILKNIGELHDNYQHFWNYKFRRQVELFQWGNYSLCKAGCEIRTWKRLAVFLGAKPMSHRTKRPGVGAALGKFCKLGLSPRLDIAFMGLEKRLISKCVTVKTNGEN